MTKKERIDKMIKQRERVAFDQNFVTDLNIYELVVGYGCNNKCIHCFQGSKKDENLNLQAIKHIIDDLDYDRDITITGGEPTIRNDLLEILDYAHNGTRLIGIQTNGQNLYNKEYLKEIDKYVDFMLLAFHSINPKMHDIVTQVEGSGLKTFEALKNLKDANIFIQTNTVINKINYKYLVDILDYIQSILPGTRMGITFPDAIGYAINSNVVPRYNEVSFYLQKALNKYHSLLQTHYIPRCHLYPYQDKVLNWDNSHGTVYRPGIDYIDGWDKTDFGELDENTKIKSVKCKECIFDSVCDGIWKNYSSIYEDFYIDLRPIRKKNG